MKAVIIYSGKGGVGKTTTTANIARLLASQEKVACNQARFCTC